MKNKRQFQILEASKQLFLRHGFQKVTLSDIAKESGVSRPTVYQAFPNKEEIFKAMVEEHYRVALGRVDEVLESEKPVKERLLGMVDIWLLEPFRMVHRSPEAEELLNCSFPFADPTIESGYTEFEKRLVKLFRQTDLKFEVSIPQLAHFVAVSLRGFKTLAKDERDLKHLTATLVEMTLGE